jgi:hypothetical protein
MVEVLGKAEMWQICGEPEQRTDLLANCPPGLNGDRYRDQTPGPRVELLGPGPAVAERVLHRGDAGSAIPELGTGGVSSLWALSGEAALPARAWPSGETAGLLRGPS